MRSLIHPSTALHQLETMRLIVLSSSSASINYRRHHLLPLSLLFLLVYIAFINILHVIPLTFVPSEICYSPPPSTPLLPPPLTQLIRICILSHPLGYYSSLSDSISPHLISPTPINAVNTVHYTSTVLTVSTAYTMRMCTFSYLLGSMYRHGDEYLGSLQG